jgi:hypothetical protein
MHLRKGGGVDINGQKIVLPGIDVNRGKIGYDIIGPKLGVDVKGLEIEVGVPEVWFQGIIDG